MYIFSLSCRSTEKKIWWKILAVKKRFFNPIFPRVSWDSSRNRDFYFQQSSSMQIRRLFSEGDSGKKTASSTPPIHTKPTEQQQQKKNVPDIQPSKTHKVEIQDGETKKQIKGTKIVVNSVVEQNLGNPSENAAPKTTKNQVN